MPALAAPTTHREGRRDGLGLFVRVGLDVAAVGGDGDEAGLGTLVEALDELAQRLGIGFRQGRIRYPRIDGSGEDLVGTEPLPTAETHPNDVLHVRDRLAHRVQPVLLLVAIDPDLLADLAPDRRQQLRLDRAVLATLLEVELLRERLPDRCIVSGHRTPLVIAPAPSGGLERRDRLGLPTQGREELRRDLGGEAERVTGAAWAAADRRNRTRRTLPG